MVTTRSRRAKRAQDTKNTYKKPPSKKRKLNGPKKVLKKVIEEPMDDDMKESESDDLGYLSDSIAELTVKTNGKRKKNNKKRKHRMSITRQHPQGELIRRVSCKLATTEITSSLKGRETEYSTITNFLSTSLKARKGACLFIAGSPGTGKSASLFNVENRELINWKKKPKTYGAFHVIHFKATICSSVKDIYKVLYREMCKDLKITNPENVSKDQHAARDAVTKLFTKKSKKTYKEPMLVVVLDEVDALLQGCSTKGGKFCQRVLYHLFGLPSKEHSKLILIGIANSIDMSERFIPLLEKRDCGPQVLIYRPYDEKQLITIIKHKLELCGEEEDENCSKLFDEGAIRFVSKRVSAMKGDVRQCFALCRQALLALLEDPDKVRVDVKTMIKVIQTVSGPKTVTTLLNLPFHQLQLVTVATLLFRETEKTTRGNLESFYNHVTKQAKLSSLNESGFTECLDYLISRSMISIKSNPNKNNQRLQVITFNVQEDDVKEAATKTSFLKTLLASTFTVPFRFLKKTMKK